MLCSLIHCIMSSVTADPDTDNFFIGILQQNWASCVSVVCVSFVVCFPFHLHVCFLCRLQYCVCVKFIDAYLVKIPS